LRKQPQSLARVRLSHPLARGLVGAYTPTTANVTRVGAAVLKMGADGLGFTTPTDTEYWQASGPAQSVSINPTWTILALVNGKEVRAGGAGKGSATYCERPDTYQIVKLEVNALPAARLTLRDGPTGGTTLIQLDQTGTLTGIRDVVIGTRRGTTDHKIFVNGQQVASNTATTMPFDFADATVYLGHDPLDNTAALEVASLPLVLTWNRALTDQEIWQISDNPWQIFRGADRLMMFPTLGGISETTATAAAGVATVGAAGAALSKATATSANGAATVSVAGASLSKAAATAAAGIATVSAAGAGASASTATAAAGVATVSGAGASLAATTATAAAGSAVVSAGASGGTGSNASAAAGVATVSAVGSSLAAADAVPAAGLATVSGAGSALSSSSSNPIPADGVATVSATASSLAAADPVAAAGVAFVSATTPDIPGAGGGHGTEFVGSVIRRRERRGPPISPMEANPHLRRKAEDEAAAREDADEAAAAVRGRFDAAEKPADFEVEAIASPLSDADLMAAEALAKTRENNRRAAILLALLMMEAA
jgi:hypothetical protein